MTKESNWYVVHTRPRWEKKVANLLEKQGIEQYCPLNRVKRQWSDRKKVVLEPLFTSYVFTKVKETDFLRVKQVDGVINFVCWLGKPAIIKDAEIDAIRQFLKSHEHVCLEKIDINVNDRVRIVEGPLFSQEGNVIEVLNHSVKVLLPSLGYFITAQVKSSCIERIIPHNQTASINTVKI